MSLKPPARFVSISDADDPRDRTLRLSVPFRRVWIAAHELMKNKVIMVLEDERAGSISGTTRWRQIDVRIGLDHSDGATTVDVAAETLRGPDWGGARREVRGFIKKLERTLTRGK